MYIYMGVRVIFFVISYRARVSSIAKTSTNVSSSLEYVVTDGVKTRWEVLRASAAKDMLWTNRESVVSVWKFVLTVASGVKKIHYRF